MALMTFQPKDPKEFVLFWETACWALAAPSEYAKQSPDRKKWGVNIDLGKLESYPFRRLYLFVEGESLRLIFTNDYMTRRLMVGELIYSCTEGTFNLSGILWLSMRDELEDIFTHLCRKLSLS